MDRFNVYTKDVGSLMVDDRVEISSTSSEHLNGHTGTVTDIFSGRHGTEIKVLLDSCIETWIDADDVVIL